MRVFVLIIYFLLFATSSVASDFKSRLSSSGDMQSIKQFYQKFDTFGEVKHMKFEAGENSFFSVSVASEKYEPYYLWIYKFDEELWRLVLDFPRTVNDLGKKIEVLPTGNQIQLISNQGIELVDISIQ